MKILITPAMIIGWIAGVHLVGGMLLMVVSLTVFVWAKSAERQSTLENIGLHLVCLCLLSTMSISALIHSDITIVSVLSGIKFLFTGSN